MEVTTDLSTWEVLRALQFVSRFPTVRTITSYNGASFQRAAKELAVIYKHVADGPIRNWFAKSFIARHFITPTASAHGGNHARAVQIIERPLREILGSAMPLSCPLPLLRTAFSLPLLPASFLLALWTAFSLRSEPLPLYSSAVPLPSCLPALFLPTFWPLIRHLLHTVGHSDPSLRFAAAISPRTFRRRAISMPGHFADGTPAFDSTVSKYSWKKNLT